MLNLMSLYSYIVGQYIIDTAYTYNGKLKYEAAISFT